jgi:hypothetical protein
MPESEKRSFWDRLFNTDRSSQREARVLEYIMHRVGEGAHLGDVVNEEYVRRNASREEVEEICARPELVQTARTPAARFRLRGARSHPAFEVAGTQNQRAIQPV